MVKSEHWSQAHDSYLATLFQKGPRNGGVNPKNTTKKYTTEVLEEHFPGRNPDSFLTLYIKKARLWQLNKTLTGKRSKYHTAHYFSHDCINSHTLNFHTLKTQHHARVGSA